MGRSQGEKRLFRGGELARLGAMVMLLVLLSAMIPSIRQPHLFEWMTKMTAEGVALPSGDAAAKSPDVKSVAQLPKSDENPDVAAKSGEKKTIAEKAIGEKTSDAKPTDEGSKTVAPAKSADPPKSLLDAPPPVATDDLAAAQLKEWLSVVTDKTLQNTQREMPAYYRLVKMAREQSPQDLQKSARGDRRFNDLYMSAAKHRGELLQLELNVRRIIRHEITEENEANVKELYEIWGWTDEAKAWLYMAITPDLPPGMKLGVVEERVTLVGYFFKLQGYHAGDAKPNTRPMPAPVLIGRMIWQPPPARGQDPWWLWLVMGGFIVVLVGFLAVRIFAGRRRPGRHATGKKDAYRATSPDWLRPATADDFSASPPAEATPREPNDPGAS